MHIVFFHVGDDDELPTMMVNSALHHMPEAQVTQVTDCVTRKLPGVTRVFRTNTPSNGSWMIERIDGFSNCGITEPAIYVDTDMLWLGRFDPQRALGENVALVCRRSFNGETLFNPKVERTETDPATGRVSTTTLDFSEYAGKTLNSVFPILACFTVTLNCAWWAKLLPIIHQLPSKYLDWYGDQEALKILLKQSNHRERIAFLPESMVACLPEALVMFQNPVALHFKGKSRKDLMKVFSASLYKK